MELWAGSAPAVRSLAAPPAGAGARVHRARSGLAFHVAPETGGSGLRLAHVRAWREPASTAAQATVRADAPHGGIAAAHVWLVDRGSLPQAVNPRFFWLCLIAG